MKLARHYPASRLVEFAREHPRLNIEDVTHHNLTFEKWEREDRHFTTFEADRRAVNMGFHPAEIWGWDEWIAGAAGDPTYHHRQ
jgi:hypothetical protein